MKESSIHGFLIDDFTLSSNKKRSSFENIAETKNNHPSRTKFQDIETKETSLNKICQLKSITDIQRNILEQLVNDKKVLVIEGGQKSGDGCLTIEAKINLNDEDFKHLKFEHIVIKILLCNVYSYSHYAYSLKPHSGRKVPKFVCKKRNEICSRTSNRSMEILNIKNSVYLIETLTGAISFNDILRSKSKIYLGNKKIVTELLQLLHEIFHEHYYWITRTNNLGNYLFYRNNQWIFMVTCPWKSAYMPDRLDKNLIKLANEVGGDFVKIFEVKFRNCRNDCLFSKNMRELFLNK